MARRTLLLDLDGTLWDSRPLYAEILARMSGGSAAEVENRLASGENVVRLATKRGVSRSRLPREASNSVASLRLYDGALRTLDDLRDRERASQRCTVLLETPAACPRVRVLQCVEASGVSCNARLITLATLSSS